MEDKIEVGEYVRTKTGNITKVLSVKDTVVWTDDFIDVHCRYNQGIIEKTDIIKHSKNIIDLIEEGDYANGERVFATENRINDNGEKVILVENYNEWTDDGVIANKDIKNIVTHEQYKQIEFIVEE